MNKWEQVCMVVGPDLNMGDVDTRCQIAKGHDTEPDSLHLWWNDQGTIRLRWAGTEPFDYGNGSWLASWGLAIKQPAELTD